MRELLQALRLYRAAMAVWFVGLVLVVVIGRQPTPWWLRIPLGLLCALLFMWVVPRALQRRAEKYRRHQGE